MQKKKTLLTGFAKRIKDGSKNLQNKKISRRSIKSKTLVRKKDIFLTNMDVNNKFEVNIINRSELFVRNKITDDEKRELDKLRLVKSQYDAEE